MAIFAHIETYVKMSLARATKVTKSVVCRNYIRKLHKATKGPIDNLAGNFIIM